MEYLYDLAIIGGGQAGFTAGIKASSHGLKTILIENKYLGGTCLNLGCIPTKSLLKSAEIYSSAKKSELFGVDLTAHFNIDTIFKRKDSVVEKLRKGMEFILKKSSLEFKQGVARFLDRNTLSIGEETITAKNIIIATGSKPQELNILGTEFALNSDNVLSGEAVKDEVIIIGGGVIGVEFATLFSKLDKKVCILEYADNLLPSFDLEASSAVKNALKKDNVKIVTKAKVIKIENNDTLTVYAIVNGREEVYTAGSVIICIGRKANFDNLGLEKVGVKFDRIIYTDVNCKTNIENIYAVGDVASKIQLAHFAEAQAIRSVDHILGNEQQINLDVVPGAVYTSPEIAMVGRTEKLDENEILFIGKAHMAANGKANIEDMTTGFIKTVFDAKHRIIGGVIVCSRATDMIGEISLAICNELTVEDIIKTIHPHPTLSESIRLSALDAYKNMQ